MIQTQQRPEAKERNSYLESFERFERQSNDTPSWIYPIRQAGIARFAELGFPTLQDEDWRFTNVAPIASLPFKPATDYSNDGLASGSIERLAFTGISGHRLVFVNGQYSSELSSIGKVPKGAHISNLASVLKSDPALVQKFLATQVSIEHNAFAALNNAFFTDGAFIHVPAGQVIEDPIHLLFLSTAGEPGITSHPRNIIVAEASSQVTILESYASTENTAYFTNVVTELIAGNGAVIEHCKFQDEAASAYHMATIHAHLNRQSNVTSHSFALGARLSRNNIRTVLAGHGVECILNGLYLTRDQQLADHHMVVEHAQPHCNSHEYFNGILEDRSRGVFHGRILVHPDAQKTDAKQTNKNLLLSDEASADTKPQLEIYADDVKCTHGATVGQLNDESIFYLRARGIGVETARRMLIHAFAGEIIDRIKCGAAREELDRIIWDRLEQNPEIAERH